MVLTVVLRLSTDVALQALPGQMARMVLPPRQHSKMLLARADRASGAELARLRGCGAWVPATRPQLLGEVGGAVR